MKLPFKSSLLNYLFFTSKTPRELAKYSRLTKKRKNKKTCKKKRKLIKKKI